MADVFERNGYKPAERKIGEGHLAAMGRLGWRELRNAANPSRESVADSEIGLYGSATQGEIAQDRGSYDGGHGLDAHQERPQHSHEPPERGRGQ